MHSHEGQYRYTVFKNGDVIDGRTTDDPFVVTTIENRMSRWGAFMAFLHGGNEDVFEVRVGGTPAAYRVVFRSAYPEPEPDEKSSATGLYSVPA